MICTKKQKVGKVTKMKKKHDCNNCARICRGDVIRDTHGGIKKFLPCPGQAEPGGSFMLAELALEHPQSLHDSLSALPFSVNLGFYLKNR